jgi:hypothetical protein
LEKKNGEKRRKGWEKNRIGKRMVKRREKGYARDAREWVSQATILGE